MTREQWAFTELDTRRTEDARFPTEPMRGSPEWDAYAQMKLNRARRRKARGYSRGAAYTLVAWAEDQDRRAAA